MNLDVQVLEADAKAKPRSRGDEPMRIFALAPPVTKTPLTRG